MYARVAMFENGDASRVDELIGAVRERMGSDQGPPGAKRFLMLVDREKATGISITFFETENAIREAEPAFEKMGDEFPEDVRGRRVSVETFEVAIEDIADGARAARMSSLEGSPEGIDKGIGFIEDTLVPTAGDITGWRGVVALVDRTSGRTKTITFWDGPESLRASEARADEMRSQAAEALNETITGVERYEVALSHVPAAV